MAPIRKIEIILVACLFSGCAASPEPGSYSLASDGQEPVAVTTSRVSSSAAPAYALSEEEKGIDCKRLTGRMKIRILQIRDSRSRTNSSELSRSLQLAQSQFGGSTTGIDPDAEHSRDRAMLDAYNTQLAAKGCKTLDLESELKT